jgi:hypothetical protein
VTRSPSFGCRARNPLFAKRIYTLAHCAGIFEGFPTRSPTRAGAASDLQSIVRLHRWRRAPCPQQVPLIDKSVLAFPEPAGLHHPEHFEVARTTACALHSRPVAGEWTDEQRSPPRLC